jgi:hypothetical protein
MACCKRIEYDVPRAQLGLNNPARILDITSSWVRSCEKEVGSQGESIAGVKKQVEMINDDGEVEDDEARTMWKQ